jgi:hypothetical protein
MQHFLKSAPGAADAEVVAAELLLQFPIIVNDDNAAVPVKSAPPLRRKLKKPWKQSYWYNLF